MVKFRWAALPRYEAVRLQRDWRYQIAMKDADSWSIPRAVVVPPVDGRMLRVWLRANLSHRWGLGRLDTGVRVYLLNDNDMVLFLLRWKAYVIWWNRISRHALNDIH